MMAFCPEHPKLDQNSKFTTLSETRSIPTPLIWGVSPPGEQLSCIRVIAFSQAFFLEQFFLLSIIILFSYFFFFFSHVNDVKVYFCFLFFYGYNDIVFFPHLILPMCTYTKRSFRLRINRSVIKP